MHTGHNNSNNNREKNLRHSLKSKEPDQKLLEDKRRIQIKKKKSFPLSRIRYITFLLDII